MKCKFDTIVAGLGAMGCAATWQLAQRGQRVLGIDQYAPPHDKGSSHGDTRITRLAIGEGAQYVPLALRSHAIWREVEQQTGRWLLTSTGGLIIGSTSGSQASHGVDRFVDQTVAMAERFHIEHETLDATAIRRRFPLFAVRDDECGYYEPTAGYLRPEACVRSQLELAQRLGAQLQCNEPIRAIKPSPAGDAVEVLTDRDCYVAANVVMTVGSWIRDFLPSTLARSFTVYRQVLYWFQSTTALPAFDPARFPIFIWVSNRKADMLYGFPAIDGPAGGVKVATEQFSDPTVPADFNATVAPTEIATMQQHVQEYFPALDGPCVKTVACKYTCTPDHGFMIDRLPDHPQIIVASPCSGHGFKHSAAIGEALAEMVIAGKSTIDLAPFGWRPFHAAGPAAADPA